MATFFVQRKNNTMEQAKQCIEIAVVGSSVAGALAAIRAKTLGFNVTMFGHAKDSGSLESIFEVPVTFLNSKPVSGRVFSELFSEQSEILGIKAGGIATKIGFHPQSTKLQIETLEEVVFEACQLVYSPFGSETGLLSLPCAEPFLGIGVSMDAWSDAKYYLGQPVGVYGCGKRAAEQALIAASAGAMPTIYCAEFSFNSYGLNQLLFGAGVEIFKRIEVRSLEASPSGILRGMKVTNADGNSFSQEIGALFLAQDLICDWSIFNVPAKKLLVHSFIVTGIANDIPYWDYDSQIKDVDRIDWGK